MVFTVQTKHLQIPEVDYADLEPQAQANKKMYKNPNKDKIDW
jgi:hypothetical protein